jgi:hypothetical protein
VAVETAGADLLILNVTLADPANEAKDRNGNLVIREGLLSLVTEGPVAPEDFPDVIDANGGFVLGRLDVGASAMGAYSCC